MSNILSVAALTTLALSTFEANKDTEKVYATADGNIFLSENYARNHGRQEKLEVYPISRDQATATVAASEGPTENDGAPASPAPTAPPAAPAPAAAPKKKAPAPEAPAATTA